MRFEILLVGGFALKELVRFNERRLLPLLGDSVARLLEEVPLGPVAM